MKMLNRGWKARSRLKKDLVKMIPKELISRIIDLLIREALEIIIKSLFSFFDKIIEKFNKI